jgi:hypothetical protein
MSHIISCGTEACEALQKFAAFQAHSGRTGAPLARHTTLETEASPQPETNHQRDSR